MIRIDIPQPALTVEVEERCNERTSWDDHYLVTVRLIGGAVIWQKWYTEATCAEDALDKASVELADKFRKILE